MASPGIPRLVRRLRRGTPAQQVNAAHTLYAMLEEAGPDDADVAAAPVAAAGAIPAVAQLLSSQNGELAGRAANILGCLAYDSPPRADAIVAAGAVPRLVQLMLGSSASHYRSAGNALSNTLVSAASHRAAAEAAAVEAGAIAMAIARLSAADAVVVYISAQLLRNLALGSPAVH